jgi:hypothetical protein
MRLSVILVVFLFVVGCGSNHAEDEANNPALSPGVATAEPSPGVATAEPSYYPDYYPEGVEVFVNKLNSVGAKFPDSYGGAILDQAGKRVVARVKEEGDSVQLREKLRRVAADWESIAFTISEAPHALAELHRFELQMKADKSWAGDSAPYVVHLHADELHLTISIDATAHTQEVAQGAKAFLGFSPTVVQSYGPMPARGDTP